MNTRQLEAAIIGNDTKRLQLTAPNTDEEKSIFNLCELFLRGAFEDILKSEDASKFLGKSDANPKEDLGLFLKENVDKYFKELTYDQFPYESFKLLLTGVSCLQLYVQNNWVGPETQNDPRCFLADAFSADSQDISSFILKKLEMDGYPVYYLSRHLLYLLLAKIILVDCNEHLKECMTGDWWVIRCMSIHQALLEERSPSLKEKVKQLIEKVTKTEPLATSDEFSSLMMVFHVEASLLLFHYYESGQAKDHVKSAKKISKLSTNLTGVMGKRTRYQVADKAQLMLAVKRENAEGEENHATDLEKLSLESELPVDCTLNDDTVLNQIELTNPEEMEVLNLSAEEQTVVLASLQEHRRNYEGSGDIIQEESLAHINVILSQPRNWSAVSCALLQRCYWESNSARRMERTMMQLESLVQQFEKPTKNAAQRTYLVNAVKLPPKWEIQRELGHLLVKVGAVKAALEIYERLEMWEDIIKCYQALGRTEKAEKTIREQLAIQETPSLYCFLGDVLQDIQYYEKAWELSEHHYSRAQKAMAYYHLYRGHFEESLPCFEKTLALNGLQIGVWFSYGCASMACNKLDEAAQAFRRCVNINTDNFEAWNNLASVYIKSNQKPRAFATLQEAIKCDYENWRIWENFLLTATDIGQFEEAIRASHRLMDLKDKWGDADVLKILVQAVNEKIPDAKGVPADILRPKVQEVFGRVTTKVVNDADIWRLYGELLLNSPNVTTPDQQRAVQYLQKSHRCLTQGFGWEKDVDKCKNIVEHSTKLADVYLACVGQMEDSTVVTQMLSSARLMIKGVLTKIKQQHTDPVMNVLENGLQEPCDKLESSLNNIQDVINSKKSS